METTFTKNEHIEDAKDCVQVLDCTDREDQMVEDQKRDGMVTSQQTINLKLGLHW